MARVSKDPSLYNAPPSLKVLAPTAPLSDLHLTVASPVRKPLTPPVNEAFSKLLKKNQAFLESLGKNPMYDAVIEEIRQRKIRIGSQWLTDFASCNYLGLDLDPEIMQAIPGAVAQWGTHPSWSRMLGNPLLYEILEEKLTELLHAEDCLVLPSLSVINTHCPFILSEGGDIYLDRYSHRTLYEGAAFARGLGARLISFSSFDLEGLERLLKANPSPHKKVICVDGVYSMHGRYADLPRLAKIARAHDAILYVDDAHGFGVIGEKPSSASPYGKRGNSLVNYHGESYDHVVLVTCLSKAYSSYGAFMTCSTKVKQYLKSVLVTYLYSGPVPVASLATALKGLEVNEKRGDELRARLHRLCRQMNTALKDLGFRNDNNTDFPIFNIYIENENQVDFLARFLFDHGVYVTLCPYPMVRRQDVGFRVQLTAANTPEEVDHLAETLQGLSRVVPIQKQK